MAQGTKIAQNVLVSVHRFILMSIYFKCLHNAVSIKSVTKPNSRLFLILSIPFISLFSCVELTILSAPQTIIRLFPSNFIWCLQNGVVAGGVAACRCSGPPLRSHHPPSPLTRSSNPTNSRKVQRSGWESC